MIRQNPRPPHGSHQSLKTGAPLFLWILVGVMTAIEAVLSLSDAGLTGALSLRWPAFALGAFWQPIFSGAMEPIYPGQKLLMFVTYAFLHGGFMHLALNSVILLSLGKVAASRIGERKTLLVLFISAVSGGFAFGIISSGSAPMIGASGAVFGFIGLWQAWDYEMRKLHSLPLQPVITAVLGLVAANGIIFVMLGGGLAWEAHLGGWVMGWFSARRFARH